MKLKFIVKDGKEMLVPDLDIIPIEQTTEIKKEDIKLGITKCSCMNYSFWHFIESNCVGPYSNTERFSTPISGR